MYLKWYESSSGPESDDRAQAEDHSGSLQRTTAGTEPVREWLMELDPEDRRIIGTDIRTVEFGWPIGMPVCRPMGNGLFEVRSTIMGKRMARVLFCIHDRDMVLLHGFVKKTRRTPKTELAVVLKRKGEIEK